VPRVDAVGVIVALCRVVADDAPERIEAEDVLRASVLLDYFKNHARRVYVGLYGADRIDGLAEDVARFLEERGGSWSGSPSELYETLDSQHNPGMAKDLSTALAEATQCSPVLSFERGKHHALTKEDGTRTTRPVWALFLKNTVNSVNSVSNPSDGGGEA
jgi:hypothetical protein